MGQLKLPKIPDNTLDEVVISIRGELKRALEEYASLYQSNYGDEVAVTCGSACKKDPVSGVIGV